MRTLWHRIKSFQPPLLPSLLLAVLFSATSLMIVVTASNEHMAPVLVYLLYAGAAISLTMAVWSVVLSCRLASPRQRLAAFTHRSQFTGRLVDDYSFRTVTFSYGSLTLNVILTLAKGVAGCVSSSWWLITFSLYYLILCIAKFVLIQSSRRVAALQENTTRELHEWKAYRVCGGLLLSMTLVLFGVVVLIVKDGNRFTYYGTLIFAVALWDFYCLTAAIIYMLRNRTRHSPSIVAIKTIGFASALVSILSLQTAMFASFGGDLVFQNRMNLGTGSAVSLTLFSAGLFMMIKSTRKINQLTQTEAVL